jgi:5-methylcytosine-specific restriction endonuclease McrA
MAYDKEKLDKIFKKTDGQCHICHKSLVRKNYGKKEGRGAWEVDHSKPKAKGGTDHLQNLQPSCITCNRKKRDSSTKSARAEHGHQDAPPSDDQKGAKTALGVAIGGIAGAAVGGPPGAVIGGFIGGFIGSSIK